MPDIVRVIVHTPRAQSNSSLGNIDHTNIFHFWHLDYFWDTVNTVLNNLTVNQSVNKSDVKQLIKFRIL